MPNKVQIGSYKGHPTISLAADSKRPFTFGVSKAKLALEHIEDIRRFVAQHDTEEKSAPAGEGMDVAHERISEDALAAAIGA